MEIFDQVGNDNGAESSEKECANLFKHKPFMDLYLINAATDAKRQPCFRITEANKSCDSAMTTEPRMIKLKKMSLDSSPKSLTLLKQQVAKYRISASPQNDRLQDDGSEETARGISYKRRKGPRPESTDLPLG